jgi:sugar lactone lactonase YvrE
MNPRLLVRAAVLAAALGLLPALAAPAAAAVPAAPAAPDPAGADAAGWPDLFPRTIALPPGFAPEGIAIGPGPVAYLGNRVDGAIYAASLVTGEGRIISEATNSPSLGLKSDWRGRLFVAGGNAGNARVVDARTGDVLARYQFAAGTSFVNDVVLTGGAAWFTDSANPVLYKLPLGPHGRLPGEADVVRLPLTGEIRYEPGINANGITTTPDGRALLIVQSVTGLLFRVDPATGATTAVDTGGVRLTNGDGLLRQGRTLYVVQNRLNTVAVLRLDRAGRSGEVVDRITDPRFDIPTTVAAFGGRLYLPNARFSTPVTPTTEYQVVAVARR